MSNLSAANRKKKDEFRYKFHPFNYLICRYKKLTYLFLFIHESFVGYFVDKNFRMKANFAMKRLII